MCLPAVSCGHVPVVKILLYRGIDRSLVDSDGQTAAQLTDDTEVRRLVESGWHCHTVSSLWHCLSCDTYHGWTETSCLSACWKTSVSVSCLQSVYTWHEESACEYDMNTYILCQMSTIIIYCIFIFKCVRMHMKIYSSVSMILQARNLHPCSMSIIICFSFPWYTGCLTDALHDVSYDRFLQPFVIWLI